MFTYMYMTCIWVSETPKGRVGNADCHLCWWHYILQWHLLCYQCEVSYWRYQERRCYKTMVQVSLYACLHVHTCMYVYYYVT